VRFRVGGERLLPAGSAHTRDLKTLFQEHGIVPWMRDRIPLLYSGETLVAVAHLWVAADFAARGDEPGLRVRWDDHPALD
jgi:tRNA(Ile)-lysidine synthase